MKINLNDPKDFTLERVRELIPSRDDSKHTQIRVTKDGYAYLSDKVGAEDIDDLSFRLETFFAGNDYVGKDAAESDSWVKLIYKVLDENWPNPKTSYIGEF